MSGVLLLPSVSSLGLEAAPAPVLEALVAEALERNPELKAVEAEVAAARERPAQASALPDPMLSLGYRNDGWAFSLGEEPMTNLQLMWSQDFPAWGKRGLRERLAGLAADQLDQALARARLDLEAAVKSAWFALLLARDRLALLDEEGQLWRQIEGVARARYGVGQGAQQDVIRVQVEITRIEQRRAELVAEEQAQLAALNGLVGREAGTPLPPAGSLVLRPLLQPLETALGEARERSPELEAARLAIDSAGVAVTLAQKAKKPDFRVSAAYMNRGQLDPMWEAGVGINLPLWRKRLDAGVAEAEAARQAAQQRLAALELRLRARTEERFARIRARERVAEVFEKGVVPQDRMSVEAALASYRVGSVPFVTVLEALATLYADREAYLETLAAHEQLKAGLAAASLAPDVAMAAPATAGARMGAGRSRGSAMAPAGGAGMDGTAAAAAAGASGGDAGMR